MVRSFNIKRTFSTGANSTLGMVTRILSDVTLTFESAKAFVGSTSVDVYFVEVLALPNSKVSPESEPSGIRI